MNISIRKLTYGALAAAVVFVFTRFFYFPLGASGYYHFGDAFIHFAAFLLGGPTAAIAAAVGSALADISSGYAVYAPATFLIKGLMGLAAGALMKRKSLGFYLAGCMASGAIMTAGYALFELVVPAFGAAYALANIPFNLLQWGAGLVISAVLYPVALRVRRVLPSGGPR